MHLGSVKSIRTKILPNSYVCTRGSRRTVQSMFIETLHTTLVNRFVEKWDHCRANCTTFLISSYLPSVTQYRSRLICHCCFPQNSRLDNLIDTLSLFLSRRNSFILESVESRIDTQSGWKLVTELNISKQGFRSVEGMSSTSRAFEHDPRDKWRVLNRVVRRPKRN